MKEDFLKIKRQLDEDKRLKEVIRVFNGGVMPECEVANGVYYETNVPVGILCSKVKRLKRTGINIKGVSSIGVGLPVVSTDGGTVGKNYYFIYVYYSSDNIFDHVELND